MPSQLSPLHGKWTLLANCSFVASILHSFPITPVPLAFTNPTGAAPQDGRERVHVTSHPIDQIPFPSTTSAAPFPMNVTPQRPTKISHHQTTYYVLFSSLPLFVFQVVLLLFRFLVEVLNDGRTPWKSKCSEVVSF